MSSNLGGISHKCQVALGPAGKASEASAQREAEMAFPQEWLKAGNWNSLAPQDIENEKKWVPQISEARK